MFILVYNQVIVCVYTDRFRFLIKKRRENEHASFALEQLAVF